MILGEKLGKVVSIPDKWTLTFIVTYENKDKKPNLGDYIVIEKEYSENPEEEVKWLAIVEGAREIILGENELEVKNLLAVDDIGENEKKKYFATEFICKLIGTFYDGIIRPYPRYLPNRGAKVRYPTSEELIEIAGIDSDGFKIGNLVVGGIKVAVPSSNMGIRYIPFKFNLRRLDNRRTAVFGQSGYGKSNLTKALITGYALHNPNKAVCIFDRSGEYVNASEWSKSLCEVEPIVQEQNTTVQGQTTSPGYIEGVTVKGRIVSIEVSKVLFNLEDIEIGKIIEHLLREDDKKLKALDHLCFATPDAIKEIIRLVYANIQNPNDIQILSDLIDKLEKLMQSSRSVNYSKVEAALRVLKNVVKYYYTPNSPIPVELINWIREGKIIVFNCSIVGDVFGKYKMMNSAMKKCRVCHHVG